MNHLDLDALEIMCDILTIAHASVDAALDLGAVPRATESTLSFFNILTIENDVRCPTRLRIRA